MKIETYTWENFAISNDLKELQKEIILSYNMFDKNTDKYTVIAIDNHGEKISFELLIADVVISFFEELEIDLCVPDNYEDKFEVVVDNWGKSSVTKLLWREV